MNLKNLKIDTLFGIPHSKLIDQVFSLRDPNIQVNYYSCYYYKNQKEYILPIFSFNKNLYFFKESNINLYRKNLHSLSIISKVHSFQHLTQKQEKISIFYNMDIPITILENAILSTISNNSNILKHFITKD